MSANPILAEALRGGLIESFHRGSLAIVDADGTVQTALGDIERPIFPRSAVKVLQALPLVASGAAQALDLSDEELALACCQRPAYTGHFRVGINRPEPGRQRAFGVGINRPARSRHISARPQSA